MWKPGLGAVNATIDFAKKIGRFNFKGQAGWSETRGEDEGRYEGGTRDAGSEGSVLGKGLAKEDSDNEFVGGIRNLQRPGYDTLGGAVTL